eukprot:2702696-Amphidinium_carterae.1
MLNSDNIWKPYRNTFVRTAMFLIQWLWALCCAGAHAWLPSGTSSYTVPEVPAPSLRPNPIVSSSYALPLIWMDWNPALLRIHHYRRKKKARDVINFSPDTSASYFLSFSVVFSAFLLSPREPP